VAQLKNQDPLNPMDNAQITSQMAQISTVSGIDKLNSTLQSMAASFNVGQSLQATAMIGHGVFVPGNTLQLENGAAPFGVDLAQAADKVVLSVRDGSGLVVHKVDLGPQPAGVIGFEWDGVTDSGAIAAPAATVLRSRRCRRQEDRRHRSRPGPGKRCDPGQGRRRAQGERMGSVALSDVRQVV